MSNSGIYKITNIINNKFYIGSAKYFNGRFATHKSLLRNNKHHNNYLQSSWNKYGEINFIFEKFEICEIENLIIREQYYIDNLKPEYNLRPIANSNLGCKMPESMKKAVSERNLKLYKGENNPFYGKKHTKETLNKMRNAHVFSKLNEKQVLEIKKLGLEKIKHKIIMNKFNISRSTVTSIINNKYKRRDFNV